MGKVYIVGAGPGDPELLTLKGKRVLGLADAILFDHLASESLLQFASARAERIYVGKKKSHHSFTQDEITGMLIDLAGKGKTVVRLKGGDPYIFGRGGEEAEALAEAGIAFEVVPGITAPLGIAAYTGVPLTHRSHTSVVTFVTGHALDAVEWPKVSGAETLVVFMGIHFVTEIADALIAAGRSPLTPAMAVRWGTRPDQQSVTGTLATLAGLVHAADLKPPATLIIGDVVSLRSKLDWFDKRPLRGQRIAVTRSRSQSEDLSTRLRELGADPVEVPVIELRPCSETPELQAALARLCEYDWAVFTSANAVEHFFAALFTSGQDLRALRARICAIGSATASAIAGFHLRVDRIPDDFVGDAIASAFRDIELRGQSILLPRAAAARDVVPDVLRGLGAAVHVVPVYDNVIPEGAGAVVADTFAPAHRPQWVTFTSSSTVKNLLALGGREILEGVRIASIGPVTSDTVRKHGLQVDAEATVSTMEGLVDAIVSAYQMKPFA